MDPRLDELAEVIVELAAREIEQPPPQDLEQIDEDEAPPCQLRP